MEPTHDGKLFFKEIIDMSDNTRTLKTCTTCGQRTRTRKPDPYVCRYCESHIPAESVPTPKPIPEFIAPKRPGHDRQVYHQAQAAHFCWGLCCWASSSFHS